MLSLIEQPGCNIRSRAGAALIGVGDQGAYLADDANESSDIRHKAMVGAGGARRQASIDRNQYNKSFQSVLLRQALKCAATGRNLAKAAARAVEKEERRDM